MKKSEELQWAVPKKLNIPPDPLRLRVDFHQQATVVYVYNQETVQRRIVSAMDIAHALASELEFNTGLLPPNTLWWANKSAGPVVALYEEPKIRTLAIAFEPQKPPKRYTIPVPPMIFLCQAGRPPAVFAVKKRPTSLQDQIFHAPMLNTYTNGTTCGGSNTYPTNVAKIPENFFISFFTPHCDIKGRSKKHPQNIIRLWEELNGCKTYPLDDLCPIGKINLILKEE